MEDLKRKLRSILSEMSIEVDEMAKHANPISRPIKDDNGEIIGHDMRVNPHDEESPRVNVIFTCDIQEFMNNHPELIGKLKEQYGNIKFSTDTCPKYNPHRDTKRMYHDLPGEEGGNEITKRPYDPSGNVKTTQENIKRVFNRIIEKEFDNKSEEGRRFNEVLNERSIPEIEPLERKNVDQYTPEWTNETIVYRTNSFNSYESAEDFLRAVIARATGDEAPDMKTYHLARQFNQKYSNWDSYKKSEKKYQGQTPIYKLDRRGYAEPNLDVTLKMIFEITGQKQNDNFVWTITMINKFGRKKAEDTYIKYKVNNVPYKTSINDQGHLDNIPLKVRKEVAITSEEEFSRTHTIMEDLGVQQGLIEAIHDFKQMIEDIDPESALVVANVSELDIKESVQQKKVNYIFNKIIKEIKK